MSSVALMRSRRTVRSGNTSSSSPSSCSTCAALIRMMFCCLVSDTWLNHTMGTYKVVCSNCGKAIAHAEIRFALWSVTPKSLRRAL